ncbi:MAG: aminotransferase class V-fold PLP-dependent enzyme [Cyanobacteria bacterium P01_A01_bin.135]
MTASTDLHHHRQQFPSLQQGHYFNFGGQGPMAEVALNAISTAHDKFQKLGPFSGRVNAWIGEQMAAVRGAIAAELQVAPDTITLTDSVTTGCNIPLWGINWQAGDHILLSDCEHPGIIATVQELQHRFGITYSTCPLRETLNGGDPVAVVKNALQTETRLLVVSHILWNTGQVLPLRQMVEVCHSRSAQVLVDAAQSVGVLPLNLAELGADFYAFTGHKWLCGPAGLGGLYVHPADAGSIRPTFIGWRGVTKDAAGNPTGYLSDGRRFEIATSDYALYPGLREAIALQNSWGSADDRYRRICERSAYLWQGLQSIPRVRCLRGAPPESGLVSFVIEPQEMPHNQVVAELEQQHIMVRKILDPDCIRACTHYMTTKAEVDVLVTTLGQILA